MTKDYKLLVFDWDGTLMDSEARIVACVQAAARDLELDVPSAVASRNIIGLGLGPFLVGVLSDILSGPLGIDSLRYAILIATVAYIWAGAHFLLAGKTIRRDLAAAQQADA